jgi:uncharacterized protein YutE (UPF0331/DUF86 family)
MRTEIIRTKIAEIEESLELIRENVFDICAIINTDLRFGIPRSDDDIHHRFSQAV